MAVTLNSSFEALRKAINESRTGQVKVANNTYATDIDGYGIQIALHGNVIAELYGPDDGAFTLAGWGTVTTRSRLSQILPRYLRVSQSNRRQRLHARVAFGGDGEYVDIDMDTYGWYSYRDGVLTSVEPSRLSPRLVGRP